MQNSRHSHGEFGGRALGIKYRGVALRTLTDRLAGIGLILRETGILGHKSLLRSCGPQHPIKSWCAQGSVRNKQTNKIKCKTTRENKPCLLDRAAFPSCTCVLLV